MRVLILIVLAVFLQSTPLSAQVKVLPVVSLEGSFISTNTFLCQSSMFAGITLNHRLFVMLGGGFEYILVPDKKNRYGYFTNSASLQFRILKTRHRISPMVLFNMGFGQKYPDFKRTLNSSYYPSDYENYGDYFHRLKNYESIALAADAVLGDFHLRLGLGWHSSVIEIKGPSGKIVGQRFGGPEATLGLTYTFFNQ